MDRQEICLHSLRPKSRREELAGHEPRLAVSDPLFLVSVNTDIKTHCNISGAIDNTHFLAPPMARSATPTHSLPTPRQRTALNPLPTPASAAQPSGLLRLTPSPLHA